jgi:predicted metal-dependent enzyme (double-stranded beta helix superfamily)
MSRIRSMTDEFSADGPSLVQLKSVRDCLLELSSNAELFPDEDYPAPVGDQKETLYELYAEDDRSNVLYVYRPGPGKVSPVHDHSTWAVIVGLEGEEMNLIWKRLGEDSGKTCRLAYDRLELVGPGKGAYYRKDDIHSISIRDDKPIKHLHLYGHCLLDLPTRRDFDPVAGTWDYQRGRPTVIQRS